MLTMLIPLFFIIIIQSGSIVGTVAQSQFEIFQEFLSPVVIEHYDKLVITFISSLC